MVLVEVFGSHWSKNSANYPGEVQVPLATESEK